MFILSGIHNCGDKNESFRLVEHKAVVGGTAGPAMAVPLFLPCL